MFPWLLKRDQISSNNPLLSLTGKHSTTIIFLNSLLRLFSYNMHPFKVGFVITRFVFGLYGLNRFLISPRLYYCASIRGLPWEQYTTLHSRNTAGYYLKWQIGERKLRYVFSYFSSFIRYLRSVSFLSKLYRNSSSNTVHICIDCLLNKSAKLLISRITRKRKGNPILFSYS